MKQKSHSQAYHITNQDDFNRVIKGNNQEEEEEETKKEEEEDIYDEVNEEANQIITALEDIMAELKGVKPSEIEEVVNTILTEKDKNELRKLYYTFFHDLPDDNSIKIYVLQLLTTLFIPIMRNTEEYNKKLIEYRARLEKEEDEDEGETSLSELEEVEEVTHDLSKSIV